MSEQDTYVEELKTDVITLINQRAKLREIVEKQKLVIDELNDNYLKLNVKFEAEQAKVEAANKILADITQNHEYQSFYENGLIPCKANCARYYEKLCEQILELKLTLEIPRKENQDSQGKCAICHQYFNDTDEQTVDSKQRIMHTHCWRYEVPKENTNP